MNREFLKNLGLEDDAIEKIMKEHGKTVNELKDKASNADNLQKQIDDYKEQISERDKQLDDLSKQVKDNEELTAEIERLKEENKIATEELRVKLEKQQKDFAIENALRDAKVKNPKVAKRSINMDEITLKDGKLIGFDEQFDKIKEAFAFEDDKPSGLKGRKSHETGNNPPPVDKNPFSDEH